MNLAFLPLFTPFMSAGPGSLVGLFECVHFGRRWKESGEHGILNHLMRGDRQRFCPACSGAASSQRPLTGSDTSLCCRPECVCVCVCVGASPALLHPAWLQLCTIFFFSSHISAFISHFLTSSACLSGLGVFGVSGQLETYLRVRWGFKWEAGRESVWCVGRRCRGQGRSLRVFGLGLQLACAVGAGARRGNPEKEINKQVAARVLHLCVWSLPRPWSLWHTPLPIRWTKHTNMLTMGV